MILKLCVWVITLPLIVWCCYSNDRFITVCKALYYQIQRYVQSCSCDKHTAQWWAWPWVSGSSGTTSPVSRMVSPCKHTHENTHMSTNPATLIGMPAIIRSANHVGDGSKGQSSALRYESTDPPASWMVQAGGGGGVTVWGMISWNTLSTWRLIERCLYIVYLSTVSASLHGHNLSSYNGFWRSDSTPRHRVIPTGFHRNDGSGYSDTLSMVRETWTFDSSSRSSYSLTEQLTNRDIIMSRSRISETCFKDVLESKP